MIVDVDFGNYRLSFLNQDKFVFTHGYGDYNETELTRRQLEALRMMIDAALNTSAEELDV
jgi:hypothetical protein